MTEEVAKAVFGPWSNAALGNRLAEARAILESFVHGELFFVRKPPCKNVHAPLAWLEEEDENVWEFRIGREKKGVRIFGRFAKRDVFVATNWKGKEHLVAKNSEEMKALYHPEMQKCKTEWTNLFPAYPPHIGSEIHDYVSNARPPIKN